MKFRVKEREVITGIAAAGTVIALRRTGFAVPAVGPLSSPMVAILLGLALASFVDGGGTVGDVVEGAGYGLIAFGAMAL